MTFKRALERLSAASGTTVYYVTDAWLPDEPDHSVAIGTMDLAHTSYSLHLHDVPLSTALDVLLAIANEQQEWEQLQYAREPNGSIRIWDLRDHPPQLRVFNVGDLLRRDEAFLEEQAIPLDPKPFSAPSHEDAETRSKRRLIELIQRTIAPHIWDATTGFRIIWFGGTLVVVAPPPQCDQVAQLLASLRTARRQPSWPPFPLLERQIAQLDLDHVPLFEAVRRVSQASSTRLVVDSEFTSDAVRNTRISLRLTNAPLRRALEEIVSQAPIVELDYQVVDDAVLLAYSFENDSLHRWHTYGVGDLLGKYHDDLIRFYLTVGGGPSDNAIAALAELIRENSGDYNDSEDPEESDVFAGVLVTSFKSCRTQIEVASLLQALRQAASEPDALTVNSPDGPRTLTSRKYPVQMLTRVYNVRDLVTRAAQHILQRPIDVDSTESAEGAVFRRLTSRLQFAAVPDLPSGDPFSCRALGYRLIINATPDGHAKVQSLLQAFRAADRNPELEEDQ